MSRISYIGRDENDKAVWVETGSPEHQAYLAGVAHERSNFIPDEGVFISPIDHKAYSGRAGMREHNARHNVINNRDLAGLQTGINPTGKGPTQPSRRERQEIRETIAQVARQRGYLEGQ